MFQQTLRNDHFTSTYDSGYYPNFSWNCDQNYQNLQPSFQMPDHISYHTQHLDPYLNPSDSDKSSLYKSIEALLEADANLAQTQQTFMQTVTQDRQLLNSRVQATSELDFQMSRLANIISERNKNQFPSQTEVNPKFQINQTPHDNVNAIISHGDENFISDPIPEAPHEKFKKPISQIDNHVVEIYEGGEFNSETNCSLDQLNEPNEFYDQPTAVILVDESVTWSNFEDNEIESINHDDVKLNYETYPDIHEYVKVLPSDEILYDLSAENEIIIEDSSFDHNSIVKDSVGEPPPVSKLFNATLDQTVLENNETKKAFISNDIIHNQEFQVINLLKQHKEAFNWFTNDVSGMSFILVVDIISLVFYFVLRRVLEIFDNFVTIVVFPRSGIG